MRLRYIELFGGIGACTQALKKLNIETELVDYVEIDKYAVKSFNAMNGTNYEPQDITKWDKDLENIFRNLLTENIHENKQKTINDLINEL